MRSAAEKEIRDAVVARLRQLMPNARIVHELNVAGTGTNRIDVAAVASRAIVGVEIKSEKDKLDRLADQWDAFSKCCHRVVVAAHDKHFRDYRPKHYRDDLPPYRYLDHPLFFDKPWHDFHVWRFPRPDKPNQSYHKPWTFDALRDTQVQPRATDMLRMLWAEELREECGRHRIPANSRSTRHFMIQQMVWLMTGREICEAVCRQLRARPFAEGDKQIVEMKTQVAAE
ncbi:NERD domain-containing protein [Mesorhizobium xinjiangense]|uniref:NERD domain-containing protein n=1 Tax=Mesorhizobium xinjiangense TaxID=2678685 RepID=UPI0012EE215F|nr:NERD domain-containing protein [Mesorhizobium xinjiangense]